MPTRLEELQAGLQKPLDSLPPTGAGTDRLGAAKVRQIHAALAGSCGRAAQQDGCTFGNYIYALNQHLKAGGPTRAQTLVILDGATMAELTGIPRSPLDQCCPHKAATWP